MVKLPAGMGTILKYKLEPGMYCLYAVNSCAERALIKANNNIGMKIFFKSIVLIL
jgi:hypothetical protein